MRISVAIASLALFLASASARAIELEARKKCATADPVTVTVTVTSTGETMEPTSTDASTTTTSSESSTTTTTSGGSSGGSGGTWDQSNFFPVPFKKAFTTLPQSLVSLNGVDFVDFDIKTLNASHISTGLTEDVVTPPGDAPDGVKAFEAKYPKGSYNPTGSPRGGFGFYLGDPLNTDFAFEGANEIMYSYAVYFPEGFDWVKGGKLPGSYGGSTADLAYGCSGGRQDGRDSCFSLRLMWRREGAGEIYAYVPKVDANDKAFSALKGTIPDPEYGWSVARGAFSWKAGGWTVVAERVKMNTVGQADGEIELFVNGESKIKAENVMIRQKEETVFRGGHFQTFFGGSSSDWATPEDTETYFAGVSAAILS